MIKTFTQWLPAPFYRLDFVVIDRLVSEDQSHRHYSSDLYLVDRETDTGLRWIRSGSSFSRPKQPEGT
jgi:hypothetical protein